MASDLARRRDRASTAQLCGDAHLVNFGVFASPERDLVFDVNDFDETLPGPLEWDVKRLAASLEIAARERRLRREHERRGHRASGRPRLSGGDASSLPTRQPRVWYARLDVERTPLAGEKLRGTAERKPRAEGSPRRARKTALSAFDKLDEVVDGEPGIVSRPAADRAAARARLRRATRRSKSSATPLPARAIGAHLAEDRRHSSSSYRFVDLARKVVGVGSVGTRCWIALLLGAGRA